MNFLEISRNRVLILSGALALTDRHTRDPTYQMIVFVSSTFTDSQVERNYLMDELLFETQEIFYEIASNYPNFLGRKYIGAVSFPYGRRYKSSSDEMKKEISDMVTNPGSVFDLFKENIYMPGEEEQLGKMIKTMEMISKNDINDKDSISALREEISQVNSFSSL